MGMFEVLMKLANLGSPNQTEEVSLLVDIAATLSWIPRTVLDKLGGQSFSRLRLPMVIVWNATPGRSIDS